MSIHISSGQMTSLPQYSIIIKNKIPEAGYNSKNITKSVSFVYSDKFDVFNLNGSGTYLSVNNTSTIQNVMLNYDDKVLFVLKNSIKFDDKLINVILNEKTIEYCGIQFYLSKSSGDEYATKYEVEMSLIELPNTQPIDNIDLQNYDTILQYLPDDKYKFKLFYVQKDENSLDFILSFFIDGFAPEQYNGFYLYLFSELYNINGNDNFISKYLYEVVDVDNSSEVFNINSNELLQNQAIIGTKSLPVYLSDNIVNYWANGRQTITLTCVYGKYYTYDGDTNSKDSTEIALDGIDGRMIDIGDIVVPTRLYTKPDNTNIELPIALNSDGSAKEFEVLSSEIEFNNGKLVTHLKLMEVK
jgi:hypothetical protein